MTVAFQSAWRKCKCPIYASQDGVCGCPQFWERKDSSPAPTRTTTTSAQMSVEAQLGATATSSPKPNERDKKDVETSCETSHFVGPPRETCFFWYHGSCHRGDGCTFAHESHITWPITPPPNFVHFEPCDLPLCPLRQDLAVLMEDPRRGRPVWRSRLEGQLDGAAASFLGRDVSTEGTSSDTESAHRADDAHDQSMDLDATPMHSLIDPSSRPLNGSYSDSDSVPSEVGKSEKGDDAAYAEQKINDVASFTSQLDDGDYFDLSGGKPLPPSSDIDEPVILSLSHPGTLRKRNSESVSSPNQEESECKRPRKRATHKPYAETRQPEGLTRGRTSSEAEHTANAVAITDNYSENTKFSAGPPHHLPPKPESPAPGHLFTNMQQPTPPRSNDGVPTGPRALGGGAPVCFYWYHKGHCKPKMRRNGQLMTCNYAHTLDGPHPQVSLPPNITDHDPFCPMPLCPVPRTQPLANSLYPSNPSTGVLREERDRRQNQSRKDRAANARHGSASREAMLGRHVVTRDRDANGRRNMHKPPQLSGANSESVRVRKKPHNKHKGNDLVGMDSHNGGIKAVKWVKKKYAQKGETYGRLKKEDTVLDYGDVSLQDPQASSSAVPVDRDLVDDGSAAFLEQLSAELSHPGWMNVADPGGDVIGGHTNDSMGEEGAPLQMHEDNGMEDTVNLAASTSEPRLDWDTDEVRRLFGEID